MKIGNTEKKIFISSERLRGGQIDFPQAFLGISRKRHIIISNICEITHVDNAKLSLITLITFFIQT